MYILGSGVYYSDISSIVEKIADNKARQYKKIAYLGPEDIRQEVRLKCFTALSKFNIKKTKNDLFMFLSVCADNRIRDIKRSIFYQYYDKTKCKFCHGQSITSPSGFYCPKCNTADNKNTFKMNINNPIRVNNGLLDDDFCLPSQKMEIIDYIRFNLPSGLMPIFNRLEKLEFKMGALKKGDRYKISNEIMFILKKYYEE